DAGHLPIGILDALDHDLLVTAELIDNEPELGAIAGFGDDHDTLRNAARLRFDVEEIAEIDELYQLTPQFQHSARIQEVVRLTAAGMQTFHDRGHRHHIDVLADLDDHAIHHRKCERQCQLDGHALTALRLERNASAEVLDVAAHDVHADTATGNVGDGVRGRETGQED